MNPKMYVFYVNGYREQGGMESHYFVGEDMASVALDVLDLDPAYEIMHIQQMGELTGVVDGKIEMYGCNPPPSEGNE